jgi:uncharacterized phage protein (TIGR02218 family)
MFEDDAYTIENVFTGHLAKSLIKDGICTMVFKDLLYVLDREICRVRIQSLCNNRLFDATCALVAATYKTTCACTVDATGKIITIAHPSPAVAADWFTQGKVVYNGLSRFISKHTQYEGDETLNITLPITGLTTGPIDIYPGCDKRPETCSTKFAASNITNFVGMPYVPTKDPMLIPLTNAQ